MAKIPERVEILNCGFKTERGVGKPNIVLGQDEAVDHPTVWCKSFFPREGQNLIAILSAELKDGGNSLQATCSEENCRHFRGGKRAVFSL